MVIGHSELEIILSKLRREERKDQLGNYIAMASLGVVMLVNLVATIWWASNVDTRLTFVEKTRNTREEGTGRDGRLTMLENAQNQNVMVHRKLEEVLDRIDVKVDEIAEDVAGMRGKHTDFGHEEGKPRL